MINAGGHRPVIGILGGMGPLAGIDFAKKLVQTSARLRSVQSDQDHTPFVLWSDPQIPDRTAHVVDSTCPDPFPAMAAGVRGLAQAGADVIAVACNTAHHWHRRLSECSPVPLLHIVDSAIAALRKPAGVERIGVLAGLATLKLQMYQTKLKARGYCCITPSVTDAEKFVMPAIRLVKQGRIEAAVPFAQRALELLAQRGATTVILGCTELPLVFEQLDASVDIAIIDPAEALALEAVQWGCLSADASERRPPGF